MISFDCKKAALIGASLILLLILISHAADSVAGADDTYRCGTRLVTKGDSMYQVLAKCGNPTFTTVRYEKRIQRDFYPNLFPPPGSGERQRYRQPFLNEEYVQVEDWTYNRGPNSLLTTLTFENGRLVDIDTDGYGY